MFYFVVPLKTIYKLTVLVVSKKCILTNGSSSKVHKKHINTFAAVCYNFISILLNVQSNLVNTKSMGTSKFFVLTDFHAKQILSLQSERLISVVLKI